MTTDNAIPERAIGADHSPAQAIPLGQEIPSIDSLIAGFLAGRPDLSREQVALTVAGALATLVAKGEPAAPSSGESETSQPAASPATATEGINDGEAVVAEPNPGDETDRRETSRSIEAATNTFEAHPGKPFSFMLGHWDMPFEDPNSIDKPRIITGPVAVITPVLDEISNPFGNDNPEVKKLRTGPKIYVIDIGQMRHEEAEAFIKEQARMLAEDSGDPSTYDHYLAEINASNFKAMVANKAGLEGDWSPVNCSLLVSGLFDTNVDAAFPYVEPIEDITPVRYRLGIEHDGQPKLIKGTRWPLGTVSLTSGNVITVSPYLDASKFSELNEYPYFRIETLQDEAPTTPDIEERHESMSTRTVDAPTHQQPQDEAEVPPATQPNTAASTSQAPVQPNGPDKPAANAQPSTSSRSSIPVSFHGPGDGS